jgi:peptidoglycan-N-acetylglucosamine deacetylase
MPRSTQCRTTGCTVAVGRSRVRSTDISYATEDELPAGATVGDLGPQVPRRAVLGLVLAGLGALLSSCGGRRHSPHRLSSATLPPTTAPTTTSTVVQLDHIPPPVPGSPQVLFHGPSGTRQIAWTVDDGLSPGCVSDYVSFAQSTGTHLTFNPNGFLGPIWSAHAEVLRELLAAGQVQMANHTFSHRDLTTLSKQEITDEIEQNESWIVDTFGVTARPWLRPPYGRHDARTDAIAASLGYTHIALWNGSFADSGLITAQQLMGMAEKYLQPGTIMIGHANYMTIVPLFGQILELIAQRGLVPVTLDEMFGPSAVSVDSTLRERTASNR